MSIMGKKLLIRVRNNFIAGIAILLPVLVTIVVSYYFIIKLNQFILEPIIKYLEPVLLYDYLIHAAKILLFIIIVIFISIIGLSAKSILVRKSFGGLEKIFLKVPIVGKIYNASKQISNAYLGEGKGIFKKVVLIEYPRRGIYSVGFVTSDNKGEIQYKTEKQLLNIFIPTTPNPTSGIFLLVPKDEVIVLDMSAEEGLKLIISGGAVAPGYKLPPS